jgi:hypothetical protein
MTKLDEKALELRSVLGLDEETKAVLGEIDMRVMTEGYTLAQAIREGGMVSKQAVNSWGDGESACALTAATLAAKARGLI